MTPLSEIIDLFSRLASHLQNQEAKVDDDEAINLSISKLSHSLNLGDDSRVEFLDTALSLMSFDAPKVFDSVIDFSVKTIVSVLSSSVTCGVLQFHNEHVLLVGSSIPLHGCLELVDVCSDVLVKLDERGVSSLLLLRACLRLVVSVSRYQFSYSRICFLDVKLSNGRKAAVTKLLRHFPTEEFTSDSNQMPLRLLLWYLDPLALKDDVSKILQESMARPFICLSKEFHDRMEWKVIAICLCLSPVMFTETRILFHNWFLLTGLASILEFLVVLVSVILDIVSIPSCWGIPLQLGSSLPFSSAYFPNKNRLVRIFTRPLSYEGIMSLVQATSKQNFHAKEQIDLTSATRLHTRDHKSIWALAISFPDWFHFATVLLFSKKACQENVPLKFMLEAAKVGMQDVESASVTAANYISWILSPIDKTKQELLIDLLTQVSESWTMKLLGSGRRHNNSEFRKKTKKSKVHDSEDHAYQNLVSWLNDFQSLYMQLCIRSLSDPASCEVKTAHSPSVQKNEMYKRIILGVVIGFLDCISKEECQLLLHYVATGKINQLGKTRGSDWNNGKDHLERHGNSAASTAEFSKMEAIAGACMVFKLTDTVESMSASLCETEERGENLICQLKVKTGKYLIKCIERLIQLDVGEDRRQILTDLSKRLVHWKQQGQEITQVDENLESAISKLSEKLSSIQNL